MDRLIISGLEATAVIGVRAWERQLRQRVVIDLQLATDATSAATHDALPDALDYGAVARRVSALVEASEYQLIESLAEVIARTLLDEFATDDVVVRVTKPAAVPNADGVAIEIQRRR